MRTHSERVLSWLLDSDPAIRWQVLRDLTDEPEAVLASERQRVASEGWGAHLLAMQAADGRWGEATWNHGWDSTMHVLMLLRDFGLDPASHAAQLALARVREQVTWKDCGPPECETNAFFDGETEPCINAQVALSGAYFGQDVRGLVDRLLSEQQPDGGWNCDAEGGSRVSSFHTTICVLEALLERERQVGPQGALTAARRRGEEYLLDRHLFRRRSTGEVIVGRKRHEQPWTEFAFPNWWHYDVLRGLDYLRLSGAAPDPRAAEAIALVESKRTSDGVWLREVEHEGQMPVVIDAGVGKPSRWVTLRALRILDWYRQSAS